MSNTTSVGNLSLNITARITRALNAVDKLTVSLGKANQQLVLMGLQTGKIGTVATQPVKKLNDELGKTKKQADANTKALQTMSGTLSKAGQVFAYQIGFGSLQQSINTLKNIGVASFKEAIDFVENYNLFNVSFGGEVQEALKFQNQLNQAFAVNMSESLRYQGFFKNLTTSLGITNDASALLSENLTKLTYDLSSLYNVQFVDMYTKLQSGMIGQTKPLRSVGIDVTQQTLQPYLYDMGINKKVTELTQAEKVLLRYIAILKQSSTAHGDFARTIASPANQLKILRDQIAELGRWFGTVFMGILGGILPYLNGFIIALKEIMKSLAVLFGFNLSDYNFLGQAEIPDIEGDLGRANQSAKELQKTLMGFDEINNMSSQSSSGNQPYLTGGYSETYTKLLEELEGYDNLMGSIRSKASEISENILNWLGFTKSINEETGEVVWNLERMEVGSWAIASAIGVLVATPIIGFISNIAKFLGFNSGFKIMGGLVNTLTGGFGKMVTAITGLNPIVAAVIAVSALFVGALIQLWQESDTFREKVGQAFKTVTELGTTFYNAIKPYIETIMRSFQALWEFGIKPLWEGWVKFVEAVMSVMFALLDYTKPALNLLAELFGNLSGVTYSTITILNVMATLILGTVGWALKGLGNSIIWLVDNIGSFKTNWDSTWKAIGSGIGGFFKPITDFFNSFVKWFGDKINELIDKYNSVKFLPDIPRIDNSGSGTNIGGGTGGTRTTTVTTKNGNKVIKPTTNTSGGNKYTPNIGMYASGGMPSVGEMFIARESGAELVGSIGSRSAVMNNDQIVQAVSQGVAQAVASVMNSDGSTTVNLIVNDDVFGRAIIKSANRTMKNTNLVLDI